MRITCFHILLNVIKYPEHIVYWLHWLGPQELIQMYFVPACFIVFWTLSFFGLGKSRHSKKKQGVLNHIIDLYLQIVNSLRGNECFCVLCYLGYDLKPSLLLKWVYKLILMQDPLLFLCLQVAAILHRISSLTSEDNAVILLWGHKDGATWGSLRRSTQGEDVSSSVLFHGYISFSLPTLLISV